MISAIKFSFGSGPACQLQQGATRQGATGCNTLQQGATNTSSHEGPFGANILHVMNF